MSTFLTEPQWYDADGNLITTKSVKVDNAVHADQADGATTAQKANKSDSLQIGGVYYTFRFAGDSTLEINKVDG